MPGVMRKLWRAIAGLFAIVVVLLAVLLGLLRLALVQAPEYREQIEARAGEALGWPLQIGAMDARLGLRGPEFRFTDARVLTRDGERIVVRAATGAMQLDLRALLRGQLRPGQVTLSGVSLRIERDAAGDWRLLGEEGPELVAGKSVPMAARGELPRLADLPRGRLHLRMVNLEFEDLRRAHGPSNFLIDELDMTLEREALALSATGRLPAGVGGTAALSLEVSGQDERGYPREWSGGLSFTALDFEALAGLVGPGARLPPAGVVDGSVSVVVAGGRLERAAGEARARNLGLELPAHAAALPDQLNYERLGAAFEWTRAPQGWQLRMDDLDVASGARRWASDYLGVEFARDEATRRLDVRSERLELAELSAAAPWLPQRARDVVEALAPTGTVRDLELRLGLPSAEGVSPEIAVAATFAGLSAQPMDAWPGVENLSGAVSGNDREGTAELAAGEASVTFPALFREPLRLDKGAAQLQWRRDGSGLRLAASEVTLENSDLRAEGALELLLPRMGTDRDTDTSPQLKIEARVERASLAAASRYLPAGIMAPTVVAWLDRALQGGLIQGGRVLFDGPTRAFPFRADEGLFRAEFSLASGELKFHRGWPLADSLEADVRFENEGLWAEIGAGQLLGMSAGPLQAAIPDLREGQLAITGRAAGSLAAAHAVVLAAEQLDALLGPGLRPATPGAGSVAADLDLMLPLRSIRDFRARVGLQIDNGELSYGFLGEPLRDIHARIDIDNGRVSSTAARARLAGRPLTARVYVAADSAVRVDAQGELDSPGLARVLRIPLDDWSEGQARWEGQVRFPAPGSDERLEMEIVSELQGLAIRLPQPLGKRADERRRLTVSARFPAPDLIDSALEWDEGLRLALRADTSGPAPVLRVVPGAPHGDKAGVVFSGAVKRIDLAAWLAVKSPRDIDPSGLHSMLAGGRLLVGELAAPLLQLEDALLDLSRTDAGWQLGLAGDRAEGTVEVPFTPGDGQPLKIRLSRLWLGGEGGSETAPGGAQDGAGEPGMLEPSSVPPLDIAIDDLRFGSIRLGRATGEVLRIPGGIELPGLDVAGEGFAIRAEGHARHGAGVDDSRLTLSLRSDDIGKAQEFAGFNRSMDSPRGVFEAQVHWQGGLRSDWLSVVEGTGSLSIHEGTLVGVEPGAGRVFGLLSIQLLPRRLALDFKDVFGEGTRFDRITGDFIFDDGHAHTDNLLMRGPAANIVVVGRTGLVARDYDQTAVIAADLGRTLPVAGTVVGGPAVGAALFLLSEVLRKPFQTQITYRITGPWENPQVERVAAGTLPPPGPEGASPSQAPAEPEAPAQPDRDEGAP